MSIQYDMDTLLLCNALNVFRITEEFLAKNDGVKKPISFMFHGKANQFKNSRSVTDID